MLTVGEFFAFLSLSPKESNFNYTISFPHHRCYRLRFWANSFSVRAITPHGPILPFDLPPIIAVARSTHPLRPWSSSRCDYDTVTGGQPNDLFPSLLPVRTHSFLSPFPMPFVIVFFVSFFPCSVSVCRPPKRPPDSSLPGQGESRQRGPDHLTPSPHPYTRDIDIVSLHLCSALPLSPPRFQVSFFFSSLSLLFVTCLSLPPPPPSSRSIDSHPTRS